jgi:predicted Zn-dependent protease
LGNNININKLLLLLFLINTGILSAQDLDVRNALSRLERSINQAEEEFTMRDSYFLGRAVAVHVLNRYQLYTENPAVSEYLNLILKALVINSPVPNWFNGYFVMALDTPEINAFATPGGHIFITRGLMELTSSEDMLAAIIAHELAHIQLQHGTADIMNTRLVNELTQERERISQNIIMRTQQDFTASINEMVNNLFSGGYSQLQEFEADLKAFELLVSAGYYPGSLIELLRILDRIQGNQIARLNTSHPLPALRIDNLERNMPPISQFIDTSSVRRERFNRIMGR